MIDLIRQLSQLLDADTDADADVSVSPSLALPIALAALFSLNIHKFTDRDTNTVVDTDTVAVIDTDTLLLELNSCGRAKINPKGVAKLC